jgi:MYXO-CTERM domain-containing protein
MRHLLSPKRAAAGLLALGLTLPLAGQASAQAPNEPARTTTETTTKQDDHRDRGWDLGWLGLLGLLGLAGLLRRSEYTPRRTDDVTRRTT